MPGGLDAELLARGKDFDPWNAEEEAKGSKSPTMVKQLQRNNVDMARYSRRDAPGGNINAHLFAPFPQNNFSSDLALYPLSVSVVKKVVDLDKELVKKLAEEGGAVHDIRREACKQMNRPLRRVERDYIDEQIKLYAAENARIAEEARRDVHALAAANKVTELSMFFGPLLPNARVYHANKPNAQGWPPIVTAIKHGRAMVIQILIKYGAEREIQLGPLQSSTLMIAVLERQMKCIEMLYNNDCDPERRDTKGMTPLMEAARSGAIDIVDELVKRGVATDTEDIHGNTALLHAVKFGQTEIAHLLLEGGGRTPPSNLEHRNHFGETAIIRASYEGGASTIQHGKECVALLIDKKSDMEV